MVLGGLALDQATKMWARATLMHREAQSYFHDVFRWEYVENTGAFLSLGDGLPYVWSMLIFSALPVLFLAFLAYYLHRHAHQVTPPLVVAFALIFSGGLGNVIDRILYDRHVTDFMNLGIGSLRTGIFNVADVWVMIGIGMTLLFYGQIQQIGKTEDAQ